ncbi:MAG: hypothetical protein HYT15_01620 [Candidatus Magasanikbacteria bacterium]|nr:hypothetical protein [Candidatus Magasanikbacteria bacterium]
MKKKIVSLYSILYFLLATAIPSSIHAQTVATSPAPQPLQPTKQLEAIITSDDLVRINKKVIFDASDSTLLSSTTPAEYVWDFGSGPKVTGKEIVQQFSTVGKKTITLTIRQATSTASISKDIFVFNNSALLIIDQKNQEGIKNLQTQAAENGVALQLLPIAEKEGALLTEDALVQKIKENTDYIKDSNVLIFYTQSPLGMQAFNLYWKDLKPEDKTIIKNKFFAVISDSDLNTISNLAYQTFNLVEPSYILLTRKEAINPIFITKETDQITGTLQSRSIEYRIIDQRGDKSSVFLLSHFVTDLVSKGVSSNIVYIILIVPFLAFIASFARQVIGISAFGVYTPVIIAISFFILGLGLGILTFIFAVVIGYIAKFILNKFELLYLPKMALHLALISLSFLFVIWLALQYGTSVPLSMAIFPMLVMSTVSEKFMAAQNEEGVRNAIVAVAGTLLIVIASYYFITWAYFNNVLLSWPELVLVPVIATLLLGKFTGLRIAEYFRFRSLLTEHQE